MAKSKHFIPAALQPWIEARQRFRLTHAQVQMARELGLNPRKLGKIANHRQEPWKAPLPAFIERLYRQRFGRPGPDRVRSIEEVAAAQQARKQAGSDDRRARSASAAAAEGSPAPATGAPGTAAAGIADDVSIARLADPFEHRGSG